MRWKFWRSSIFWIFFPMVALSAIALLQFPDPISFTLTLLGGIIAVMVVMLGAFSVMFRVRYGFWFFQELFAQRKR